MSYKMFSILRKQGNVNYNYFKVFFLAPVIVDKFKYQPTRNAVRLWGKRNPHSLLVGLQTGAATVEISMRNSQKCKSWSFMQLGYNTPCCTSKGIDTLLQKLQKYLFNNVHCHATHNS